MSSVPCFFDSSSNCAASEARVAIGLSIITFLPALQGVQTDGRVQIVGQSDGDDIDVVTRQQRLVIGDQSFDAELVGGLFAALGRDLGQSSHGRVGVRLKRTDVILRPMAPAPITATL